MTNIERETQTDSLILSDLNVNAYILTFGYFILKFLIFVKFDTFRNVTKSMNVIHYNFRA